MNLLVRVLLCSMFATAFASSVRADAVPVDFTGTAVNQTNMVSSLGGVTSSTGEIISSVDGIPIFGGLLTFSTLTATSSFIFPCGFHNTYAAGGTFTLTGQIFGLPDGSTLLSGNLGSGQTTFECENTRAVSYFGQDDSTLTYVNPALLTEVRANYFGAPVQVQVTNEFDQYPDLTKVTMNSLIAVAPSPEPPSFLLFGTGLLGIGFVSLILKHIAWGLQIGQLSATLKHTTPHH